MCQYPFRGIGVGCLVVVIFISLVADSEKAKRLLAGEPKYTSLNEIIDHAWCWHQQQLEDK